MVTRYTAEMKMPTKKQAASIGLIIAFIGFFIWGRVADAAEVSIGLGYSPKHESRYQQVMLTTDDRRWYFSATRIGGDVLHDYQYGRIGAGYRVNWRRESRFSPYMRLGGVYFTDPPTDYISDDFAFDMAIGSRLWNVVELEYQHNSTAGRSSQNEGLDAVVLTVVLPFGK